MSGRAEIRLPAGVGEGEDQAVLAAWTLDDGEAVDAGDVVAEVMVAKATIEVEAPAAGVLRHDAQVEAVVEPNGLIGFIEQI